MIITVLMAINFLEAGCSHEPGPAERLRATFKTEVMEIVSDDANLSDQDDEVVRVYFKSKGCVEFSRLDAADARALLLITHTYAILTGDKRLIREADKLFASITEDGRATDDILRYRHQFLMTTRRFRDATAFAARHDLGTTPEIIDLRTRDVGGRSLIRAVASPNPVLYLEQVELSGFTGVVAVMSATCGFSQKATAEIGSDPRVAQRFSDSALLITNNSGNYSYRDMKSGNIADNIRYVWDVKEWPEVVTWLTPSFYAFENGELVSRTTGWPANEIAGRLSWLNEWLPEAGLTTNNAD